ncbi:unnamed protein product, partial [marine sediment metagenome]
MIAKRCFNINIMTSFLNPDEIVKTLPLKEGMTVADFGSGAGYFSLAIAKCLKPS